MRVVPIRNRKLIQALDEWKTWMFSHGTEYLDNLPFDELQSSKTADESTSIEYLQDRLRKPNMETGFPLHSLGFDVNNSPDKLMPAGWKDKSYELDKKMISAIGVKFSALKMYYPAGGHIGWHNNCNCPGYNLIMSYNETGNGFFQYMDPISNEIVRIDDVPGWSAKVGYFGSFDEPDKVLWHSARTYEPRLTLSYVTPDLFMWEGMVEDIMDDQQ